MIDASFLIAPCLSFLVVAASPGPATLTVAATSMAAGRGQGIALGFGLALGLAVWGVVAALGLGALMLSFAPAMVALRIAGGAYLLVLAWRSARSAMTEDSAAGRAMANRTGGQLFRSGFFLNLLNPKAVLAWTAVIAIGLPEGGGSNHLAAIVVACLGVGFLVNLGYAFLFSNPLVMTTYARVRRKCDAVFAAFFAAAGLRLIFGRGAVP